MRKLITIVLVCGYACLEAQIFTRSELPTELTQPFELLYGPDDNLWVTDSGGVVAKIDPLTGAKQIEYTAEDYFAGSPSEQLENCFQPPIGHGTLGLTLHPEFNFPASPYIYYVYSYNHGTDSLPETKFKIVQLTWDHLQDTVVAHDDLVTGLPTGYDHLGGRLMAVLQDATPYLFLTVGDNGISETNSPDCYDDQADNPNNFAQDTAYMNGKVHRFTIYGGIPEDNPIPGNSIYTRGHRNPQGLMFNNQSNVLYDIEHGDRTDDEINILVAGGNYGWKDVRGFHDGNFPGELDFVNSYVADTAAIANDSLVEPLYSWCDGELPESDEFLEWCTVAPSDGIYYSSATIPEWTNSLLVVTLKNGTVTDNEVYQFKLNSDGMSLAPSTDENPNPKTFFSEDQAQNGRLRDIAVSTDGTKIYLINNNNDMEDKITVYTYNQPENITETDSDNLGIYPNPANDQVRFTNDERIVSVDFFNAAGKLVLNQSGTVSQVNISLLPPGVYSVMVRTVSGKTATDRLIKL